MVSSDNTRMINEMLPEVRTSRMDVEKFDSGKIIDSMVRETGINRDTAEKVTTTVLKRIIQSNVQWLSGPAIREMCCSVLAEMGLLEARRRYTRIGMPLMDYEALLTQGIKENANQYDNPESIHSWAADRISSEYTLLRLLTEEQSKAHLSGDIHVHMLRYFDLRPFCVDGSTKIPILKNNYMGTIEAKDFDSYFVDDEPFINLSDEGIFFMTYSGPRLLRFVTRRKADPEMYKIKTNREKEIILSKDHRIMIFENNDYKEIQVQALRAGDRIGILTHSLIHGSLEKINLIEHLMQSCPLEQLETIYVRNLRIPLLAIKQQSGITWESLFQQAQILEYPRSWELTGSIPITQAAKLIHEYNLNVTELEISVVTSPYTLPAILELTEPLLRLIGYFVAEGNYNIQEKETYNLVLTNRNSVILEDMESCIKTSFSTYITRSFYEEKAPQFYFGGKLIYLLFRYVFGIEPGNKNKSLSNLFYNISDSKLKSLLTGLYSGDGHIIYRPEKSDCHIIYTSTSKDLIDFLSSLFSMHDIRHTIKNEKYLIDISPYFKEGLQYRLKIYGYRNVRRLSSIMGFKQPEKQEKIDDFIRNHDERSSLIEPPYEFIKEISSIAPTHPYVYDFSLEGNGTWEQQTFYANNILIHNCQEWDLRMILRYGLPPCGWRHSAVSTPANHAMVAILHAAKWLGIVQGEFSGGQGYDNFTVFMAPYLRGASYEDAKQLAQCFLFETNQIYAARGAQVPFTSISCLPAIPDSLLEVPAIGFGGKFDGVYGDYHDECNLFFRALCDVYCKGDGTGKLFNFPKHEIKIKREWIHKYEEEYLMVSREAAKFGLPYYLNMMADWMPDEVHSQCCRIILTPDGIRKVCHDPDLFDWNKSFMNLGSLQSVSLNLPRYAYQARGDDDLLFEYIDKNMELSRQILIIKQDVLHRAMTHNLIPICASKLNGVPLLDFRKQSLSIGFVGLNECVQSHTGHQLHEDPATYEFGKRILRHLYKKCEEFTESNMVKFSLWEQPAESTAERFAKLDLIHYPNEAIPLGERPDYVYYTNSDHLNYAANIPLFERIEKQAAFHPIVQGGVITHIWMGEAHPDAEGLWKFTKAIANTPTAYFTFTLDFTQCLNCMHFTNGIYNTCPHCGATDDALEWWSRVTGYYSRVKRFNKGKFQEWHDRKRYDITV